jgi:hypothetical protein
MISFTALLCPLFALAFIVVIIVTIVRTLGRTVSNVAGGGPRPLNVITQLGADGFWLSSFEPGSTVYYQYWSAGARHDGQILFQPGSDGRQFIYTGIRPDQVSVVRVENPSGDVVSNMPPVIQDDGPDIVTPILGAAAAEAAFDAISSAAQPPTPPTPPQFPSAY